MASQTRSQNLRSAAVAYGAAVAITSVLLSYLILIPQLRASDHGPRLLQAWQVIVLPTTAIVGLLSALLYDAVLRIASTGRRVGFFVGNTVVVGAGPQAVIWILNRGN